MWKFFECRNFENKNRRNPEFWKFWKNNYKKLPCPRNAIFTTQRFRQSWKSQKLKFPAILISAFYRQIQKLCQNRSLWQIPVQKPVHFVSSIPEIMSNFRNFLAKLSRKNRFKFLPNLWPIRQKLWMKLSKFRCRDNRKFIKNGFRQMWWPDKLPC